MKNTNTQEIMNFAKVSYSVAVELTYNNIHITRKLYTDRGNNARATMNWLGKQFGITNFVKGNDALRGGKSGNYVTFESNEAFDKFAQSLAEFEIRKELEEAVNAENFEKMKVQAATFIKSNPEIVEKYIAKHGNNSKGRQVAAWKLSNIAKDKGLHISKTAFHHSL